MFRNSRWWGAPAAPGRCRPGGDRRCWRGRREWRRVLQVDHLDAGKIVGRIRSLRLVDALSMGFAHGSLGQRGCRQRDVTDDAKG